MEAVAAMELCEKHEGAIEDASRIKKSSAREVEMLRALAAARDACEQLLSAAKMQ
jgi:hypothetical protein